jgi:hypothetical protein
MRKNNIKIKIICPVVFILVNIFIVKFAFAVGKGAGLPGYIGSKACGECHAETYEMWNLTPHANMLVDAKENPNRIIATYFPEDFPFTSDQIYYTLGSHWLQKYLTILDDGQIYQLPNVWNISEGEWEPYSIFDWRDKPYVIFCDGCHTVGFDYKTKTFFEEGIGCESCHGPGEKHAGSEDPDKIINPDKLSKEQRDMICEQCHTDGDSKISPGLPFPVGYIPGEDITEYFSDFFMPKPKSKDWYWGTTDYRERHRMFMFWRSKFYATSRACDVCGFDREVKQSHKDKSTSSAYMNRNQYCGTCHRTTYENFTKHSRHSERAAGCTDCHLPKLAPSKDRYSIHDHKFDFSSPKSECEECHYQTDAEEDFKYSDPLFYHINKRLSKSKKFECAYCHYKTDASHAAENGGKGKECSDCHYKKKEGDDIGKVLVYKHNSKKLKIEENLPYQELCKICHKEPVEHEHNHHKTDELKVRVEGTIQESCRRCHKPFMERW